MADSEARQEFREMKIVNVDELRIDRQYTINIYVERDGVVTSGEVIEAIAERGWVERTKMLQQTSRNRFKWSVDDASNILQQLDEDNLKVNGFNTQCTHASRFKTYILYDTPYELSQQWVRQILAPYGRIETMKRTVYRDHPTICDGRVMVTFAEIFTSQMPDIFQFRGAQILVREAGQPVRRVECTKCRTVGSHNTRDCQNQTICDSCGVEGHRRLKCPRLERVREEEERLRRERQEREIELRNEKINNTRDLDLSPHYERQNVTNSTQNKQSRAEEMLERLANGELIDLGKIGEKDSEEIQNDDSENGDEEVNQKDDSENGDEEDRQKDGEVDIQDEFEYAQKIDFSDDKLVIDEGKDRNNSVENNHEKESVGDSLNETKSTEPEVYIDKTFNEYVKTGIPPDQTVTSTPIPKAEQNDPERGRLWSERSSGQDDTSESQKKVKLAPQSTSETPLMRSLVKCAIDEIEKSQLEKSRIPAPTPQFQQPMERREGSKDRSRDKKKSKKGREHRESRSESRKGK